MTGKQAAVFLDRDGTLCEEVGYLDCIERLRLIPRAAEAIRRINEQGVRAVMITNQAGVARGYFTEGRLQEIHEEICRLLREEGALLDGIYYCPHHPTEGRPPYRMACECRKPNSGLILQAARELGLDPACSYAVGDRLADLQCAGRLGARGVLVLTGYGREELAGLPPEMEKAGIQTAPDLYGAVEWILQDLERR